MSNHNSNCKLIRGRFKCPYCKKEYMMEWALDNHKKVCSWRDEDDKKNRNN